jgi:hypothetical protein
MSCHFIGRCGHVSDDSKGCVFALPAQAAKSLREALAKCPSTQGKVPQVIGE